MEKKKKSYIPLILELLILLVQIFFLYKYIYKYATRNDYQKFMREINSFIQYKKLDPNYMKKFEEVFGKDWNMLISNYSAQSFYLVTPINIQVGICLILGVIIDFLSVCKNNSKIVPLFLFSCSSIVILIELAISIFGEKTKLDLSEDELKNFDYNLNLIQENLDDLKRTVFTLRIYLVILIATSIIQFLLSLFIRNNIKASSTLNNDEKIKISENFENTENNLFDDKN